MFDEYLDVGKAYNVKDKDKDCQKAGFTPSLTDTTSGYTSVPPKASKIEVRLPAASNLFVFILSQALSYLFLFVAPDKMPSLSRKGANQNIMFR